MALVALAMPEPARACIAADNPAWSPELQPSRLTVGVVVNTVRDGGEWSVKIEHTYVGAGLQSPFRLRHGGNCSFNTVAEAILPGQRLVTFEFSPNLEPDTVGTFGAIVWLLDAENNVIAWPSGEGAQGPATLDDLLATIPNTAVAPTPRSPAVPAGLGILLLTLALSLRILAVRNAGARDLPGDGGRW